MRNLDIVNMKNSIKGRKSKILKLFLCFLLLGVSYSFANNNNYSQLKTLSVNVNNKTLREVFQTIEKTSQFVFFYLDDAINLDRKVSIDSKDKKIDEILTELFEGTSCTYRISDRQVFISGKSAAVSAAQQQNARKITGRVTDTKGEPSHNVPLFNFCLNSRYPNSAKRSSHSFSRRAVYTSSVPSTLVR